MSTLRRHALTIELPITGSMIVRGRTNGLGTITITRTTTGFRRGVVRG
jgi:hypothetical protein